MNPIDNLELLKNEDWHLVRDVCLPIHVGGESTQPSFEADIEDSVAYVGLPSGLRLYDRTQPETITRLISIFSKAIPYIERGEYRFRLEQDGLAFRAQVGNLPGQLDLMLRVLPQKAPNLDDLKIPHAWKALMMDPDLLNGGLVLICAPSGQGKTTTASAIVRSRLEQFAGFANTCEDPPELPLAGFWGTGKCVQRPVEGVTGEAGSAGDFHAALEDTLRQFPAFTGGGTILFVGEIRDNETAAATLKAAGSGHLVIATVHAQSIPLALRRMITLASGSRDNMDPDSVRDMMAECLRGVFYQRLIWEKDDKNLRGWDRAEVKGDMLWIDSYNTTAAQALRHNQTEQLYSIVKKQTQRSRGITSEVTAARVKEGMPGTEETR